MNKSIYVIFLLIGISSCTPQEMSKVLGTITKEPTTAEIALGLKEALQLGTNEGTDILSQLDGYYMSVYKILLPPEVRKVTDKLKVIPGFDKVEEELVKKLNRAAESAAGKAKPIFVSAIKGMTFNDALNILMGQQNAATQYLHSNTNQALYQEFQPIVLSSLNEVKAAEYWEKLVTKYNSLPFVNKVNPRLDDYVTEKALEGLFGMIEVKEKKIRTDLSQRTSDLLRRVFAKQDQNP